MIVFGVGASTYAAKFEGFAFSRLTEVTITTVPAGTPTGAAQSAGRILIAFTLSSTPIRTQCRRSRCSAG